MNNYQRREIPSKSERDDGGDNPIGLIGLIFAAIIYGALIWVFIGQIF